MFLLLSTSAITLQQIPDGTKVLRAQTLLTRFSSSSNEQPVDPDFVITGCYVSQQT